MHMQATLLSRRKTNDSIYPRLISRIYFKHTQLLKIWCRIYSTDNTCFLVFLLVLCMKEDLSLFSPIGVLCKTFRRLVVVCAFLLKVFRTWRAFIFSCPILERPLTLITIKMGLIIKLRTQHIVRDTHI